MRHGRLGRSSRTQRYLHLRVNPHIGPGMSLSDQVSDQVGQARNFFDRWLGEHNGNESFPARLNDAQKESLLWIAVSFIFAAAFW